MGRHPGQLYALKHRDIVSMKRLRLELNAGTRKVGSQENRRIAVLEEELIELRPIERFDWTKMDHRSGTLKLIHNLSRANTWLHDG